MTTSLNGKTAIVTGAGSGIGLATAAALATASANVVINDHGNMAAAEKLSEQVRDNGNKALAVDADVSRADDVARLVGAAHDAFGAIDVLVNNAGIETVIPLADLEEAEWERVTMTNLKSQWLMSKAVGAHMVEKRRGAIVNVASVQAMRAVPGRTHYAPTKGAIVTLTQNLALELAPHGIRVNAVAPGLIRTAMTEPAIADPTVYADLRAQIPLGAAGEPEDVADAIVFLASDAARYITGQTLVIDGGMLIA